MAQDPLQPQDDGRIGMPAISEGMNKKPPGSAEPPRGARGEREESDEDKQRREEQKRAKKEEQKILALARKRFKRCVEAESDNRSKALEDLKFKAGDQWPEGLRKKREEKDRPCLTVNKIPAMTHQVTNDLRQNRPQIQVSPVGGKSDKEGALAFAGMIRGIERECAADIAYDTAITSAADIGFGYWRILTEYEDEDSFNRVIVIKRVRNPFTVYLDPMRTEPDGCDAKFGFVTEMIERAEFKEQYPGADQMAWSEKGPGDEYKDWITKDAVRIAEYFTLEHEFRRLVQLSNGHVGYWDDLSDEVKADVESGTIEILDERQSECQRVVWHKITALQILETQPWAGKWIPIVEVVGEEIDLQGKVIRSGLIRNAKDPQRMKNYWAELALDTPVPTPSGWTTMGQIQPGDKVFDDQGKVCCVLGMSPVHDDHPCFAVRFDDQAEIVADENHLWTVQERVKLASDGWVWDTKTLRTKDLDPAKHCIVMTKPVELPDVELPVHPYFLGHWLGDGSSNAGELCPGNQDIKEVRWLLSQFGLDVGKERHYTDRDGVFTVHGERGKLGQLGLIGNKHLPPLYLRASRKQRELLLQGLMDSDGSISATNRQCSFTTVTPAIAEGFAELLRSLGIKAVSIIRNRGERQQPAWQFSFTAGPEDEIFLLERKRTILKDRKSTPQRRTKRHRIVSITPVESVPVRCIAVDSPSHLFLAGRSMIPTHNTAKAENVALGPKTHFVAAEGQDEGYEQEWKEAATNPVPMLHYVPVSLNGQPVPPPQRLDLIGIPAGMVEAEKSAEQDMMATTGIRFDATMAERTVDESGRAIRELRRNSDVGAFHFVDNASRSLRHTGRILVDLIPKIYDTRRVVTLLRENDEEERVTVDPNGQQPMQRAPSARESAARKIFNPNIGKYGVTVTVGPSYATKRIEAADQMMKFATVMPEKGALIAHLIAKYSDWPGSDEIYRILAKALPPNLLTPDMRDLPPQLQAFVQTLTQQVARLMAERTQMLKDLTDQKADRAIKKTKIDRDFEVKLTKIFADMKVKTREMDMQVLEMAVDATNHLHGATPFDMGDPVGTAPNPGAPNPQRMPVSPV